MKKLLYFTILTLFTYHVYAQQLKSKVVFGAKELFATHVNFMNTPDLAPQITNGAIILFSDSSKTITGKGEKLLSQDNFGSGYTYYKWQQTVNNIPVENAIVVQHVKQNKLLYTNGGWLRDTTLLAKQKPSVSQLTSINKALAYINAKSYQWQYPEEEKLLKELKKDPTATYYPKPVLVYYNDGQITNISKSKLAYKLDIYAHFPLNRQLVYVDAITGAILKVRSLLRLTDIPATANTAYSGTRTIATTYASPYYHLDETGRGNGIKTYDMGKQGNYSLAGFVSNGSTTWNLGSSDIKYDLDAHWGQEVTFDFYSNNFGRNSIDNAGYNLIGYVNTSLTQLNSNFLDNVNAFWDGYKMTYGWGSSTVGSVVSLDIIGHEITHGLSDKIVGLTGFDYEKESGALDESFSDMMGTAIEFYGKSSSANWTIGEDIGITLRSMSDPKAHGQPDTYQGINWINPNCSTPDYTNDYCGVHANSGVGNKWFYLLTMGNSSVDTNSLGTAYHVSGIGMTKAQNIAYHTLFSLSNNSNYSDCRNASIAVAQSLYGTNSCEAIAVEEAWYAVGVGAAPYGLNLTSSINSACRYGTLTVNNIPSGATISWSVTSPLSISGISTGSTVSITGSGTGVVTGTVTTSCGSFPFRKTVTIGQVGGPGDIYGFANGSDICGSSTYTVYVLDGPYSYYDWTVSGGTILSGQGTTEITFQVDPYTDYSYNNFYVTCHTYDLCGNGVPNSAIEYGTISECRGGGSSSLTSYPNPADNNLTISSNTTGNGNNTVGLSNFKTPFSYKIINNTGKILKQGSSNGENVVVDTKDIMPGNYFLHIQAPNKLIRKQIIVSH